MRAWVVALLLVASGSVLLGQDTPLPDFDMLYKAARENLARAQRSVHLYAFKERRTDIHTNIFGRLGTGGTRLAEVYPSAIPRLTYRRVIQRNGMPVPAEEIAEQDRNYRERVAEFKQRPPTEQQSESTRQRAQRMINDVVDTLQFKLSRREMRDGVQTIAVSFTPKPGAQPTTREGRIAQKFAGTVWIHEANAEVMRVEAKAVDALSFGFGVVARLGEGTTALMVRKPIDGDIWMPTELRINGKGRAALVRQLVIDYVVEWFDYRRLPEGSLVPFLANPKSQ